MHPHIAEELWHALGHDTTVCDAKWPVHNEEYLVESTVTMAVSFNGKARYNIQVPADAPREEIEKTALEHEGAAKWIEGKTDKEDYRGARQDCQYRGRLIPLGKLLEMKSAESDISDPADLL